jgi:hypothetical protein
LKTKELKGYIPTPFQNVLYWLGKIYYLLFLLTVFTICGMGILYLAIEAIGYFSGTPDDTAFSLTKLGWTGWIGAIACLIIIPFAAKAIFNVIKDFFSPVKIEVFKITGLKKERVYTGRRSYLGNFIYCGERSFQIYRDTTFKIFELGQTIEVHTTPRQSDLRKVIILK